jgi:hypothetical protein
MATFTADLFMERMEEAFQLFKDALSKPTLIPIKIVSTDSDGLAHMEILQEDVPFSNPFFVKPTIFSPPDVIKVQFQTHTDATLLCGRHSPRCRVRYVLQIHVFHLVACC